MTKKNTLGNKIQAVFTLNITPSKISELINDVGFTRKTSELENDAEFITKADIKDGIIGGATKTSELENDSGFITEDGVDEKINNTLKQMKKLSYKIIESEG